MVQTDKVVEEVAEYFELLKKQYNRKELDDNIDGMVRTMRTGDYHFVVMVLERFRDNPEREADRDKIQGWLNQLTVRLHPM